MKTTTEKPVARNDRVAPKVWNEVVAAQPDPEIQLKMPWAWGSPSNLLVGRRFDTQVPQKLPPEVPFEVYYFYRAMNRRDDVSDVPLTGARFMSFW